MWAKVTQVSDVAHGPLVCLWMEYPSGEKMTGNCIIALCNFFFKRMLHPQTKQRNLFLII
jgi:hypothetical protein